MVEATQLQTQSKNLLLQSGKSQGVYHQKIEIGNMMDARAGPETLHECCVRSTT